MAEEEVKVEEESKAEEVEVEVEVEAKAEPEKEEVEVEKEETEEKPKGDFVPRSRLNLKSRMLREEQQRRQQLEDQLVQYKEQEQSRTTPAPSYSKTELEGFDARYADVEKNLRAARNDGDVDAEMDAMRSLRALDREFYQEQLQAAQDAAVSRAVSTTDYDQTVAIIEELYPELDYDSDHYAKDQALEVANLRDDLMASGRYNSASALIKAVALLYPEEAAGNGSSVANAAAATRTEEAIRRGVEAAKSVPPALVGRGRTSDKGGPAAADKLDVSKLSEAEYDALPESTKARVRGDFL